MGEGDRDRVHGISRDGSVGWGHALHWRGRGGTGRASLITHKEGVVTWRRGHGGGREGLREPTSRRLDVAVTGAVHQVATWTAVLVALRGLAAKADMQHVVRVHAQLIRTVVFFIQVSVAFLSQQVAAYIQVVIILKQMIKRVQNNRKSTFLSSYCYYS